MSERKSGWHIKNMCNKHTRSLFYSPFGLCGCVVDRSSRPGQNVIRDKLSTDFGNRWNCRVQAIVFAILSLDKRVNMLVEIRKRDSFRPMNVNHEPKKSCVHYVHEPTRSQSEDLTQSTSKDLTVNRIRGKCEGRSLLTTR